MSDAAALARFARSLRSQLFTWGGGAGGALGHGAARGVRVPTRVGGALARVPLASVACGGASTFAIGRDGSLWAWGKNQMRMGTTSGDVLAPQPVPLPHGVRALAVAVGSAHAAVLCSVDE
jgi:alpha-tubulin suppressor-like RCC1 family protein